MGRDIATRLVWKGAFAPRWGLGDGFHDPGPADCCPWPAPGDDDPRGRPANTIGRDASCQLRPTSGQVSRERAELLIRADAVILRDLDSRDETSVNGTILSRPVRLRDGDRVQVGPLIFAVSIRRVPVRAAAPKPAPVPPKPAGRRSLDDAIVSQLITDEDCPDPFSGSAIHPGETLMTDSAAEEAAGPGPAPVPSAPRASSDIARQVLRRTAQGRRP